MSLCIMLQSTDGLFLQPWKNVYKLKMMKEEGRKKNTIVATGKPV